MYNDLKLYLDLLSFWINSSPKSPISKHNWCSSSRHHDHHYKREYRNIIEWAIRSRISQRFQKKNASNFSKEQASKYLKTPSPNSIQSELLLRYVHEMLIGNTIESANEPDVRKSSHHHFSMLDGVRWTCNKTLMYEPCVTNNRFNRGVDAREVHDRKIALLEQTEAK